MQEVATIEDGELVEIDNVIKLTKPYKFEGETYEEVDLSGLENITARDMIEANKAYDRSGGFSIMPEMSMEYALFIASRAFLWLCGVTPAQPFASTKSGISG